MMALSRGTDHNFQLELDTRLLILKHVWFAPCNEGVCHYQIYANNLFISELSEMFISAKIIDSQNPKYSKKNALSEDFIKSLFVAEINGF